MKIIRPLSREEYRKLCKTIPKDHDIVLRGIAEFGFQDLRVIRTTYLFTENDAQQKFIDQLKVGLERIKRGEYPDPDHNPEDEECQ